MIHDAQWRECRRAIVAIGLATLFCAAGSSASAKSGRDVYEDTCIRCHGILQEQSSWRFFAPSGDDEALLAVVMPQGPPLNGVVGRPAGTIEGYKYSKGMRAFAATGAVWDRETLDRFLTNSRKFVKGTFMILRMEAGDRKLVLDYLEQFARHAP